MSEPRTHNFDRNRWGHAQYLEFVSDDQGATRYRGHTISTPIVREGDFIEWATEYGRARLLVESTEFVRDPDDMTFVSSAVMVRRFGHDGEVLWPDADTPERPYVYGSCKKRRRFWHLRWSGWSR